MQTYIQMFMVKGKPGKTPGASEEEGQRGSGVTTMVPFRCPENPDSQWYCLNFIICAWGFPVQGPRGSQAQIPEQDHGTLGNVVLGELEASVGWGLWGV